MSKESSKKISKKPLKKPKLSEEDISLFRMAVADAKPIKYDKIIPERQKPSPRSVQQEWHLQSILNEGGSGDWNPTDIESGEELQYSRDGLQPNTLRKLRRGKFPVEAELDLHRMTSEQARHAVANFIADCKATGRRCVRIIHGKGLSSLENKPVLKGLVDLWLRRNDDVLAFCSAKPADGGTGAVYVLIRK